MNIPTLISDNPAACTAALRALLQAVLVALVAFGAPITQAQQTAVLELGGALITISLLVSAITVKTTVPKTPSADALPASIQVPPPAQ